MIAAFLRLFALRPILAGSLLGVPILTLILLGLFMALILKFLLFVALPVTLGWLIIRAMRNANAHQADAPAPPPAAEPIQTL
jgi:uncharacterized SAM-binding protein YcdF (DUF218 family)